MKTYTFIIQIPYTILNQYIIPHLHNLFSFRCDVTLSLNPYESPEQTV